MRVALVAEQALAPVPGGVGRYTVQLARALARTAEEGDSVTGWCAWHRDLSAARVVGVRGPRRLPAPGRALPLLWQRGIGPAPRNFDVLHAPSQLFPPRCRPLVVTVHDAVPWTHPETLTPHGARWHRSMAERAVAAGAQIVTPTHAVAEQLLELVSGLTPDRVHALGGGVTDTVVTEPSQWLHAQVRRRLDLPDRFVLAVGTVEPRKGLDVLIAALGRLGSRALPLLVAGAPGWGAVSLSELASAAGVAARALGPITDEELSVVLRSATVLAAPSRSEGFGLPVAEAMAVGTPVVASDAPALVEVSGGGALISAVGDVDALAEALERVVEDAELRARLTTAGLERATEHTWTAVAQRAWALYRQLAS